MIHVLHVLEGDLAFGLRRTSEQVFQRLPEGRIRHTVVALMPQQGPPVGRKPSYRISWLGGLSVLRGMELSSLIRGTNPDVAHGWGLEAGVTAVLTNSQVPILLSVDMENLRDRKAERWLAALRGERSLSVVCPSDFVRRRVVEHGFPLESCVRVRPAVDLGALNEARKRFSREAMGLGDGDPVLLTPGPPNRNEGQYLVLWAAALLQQLPGLKNIRVIVPGESSELERLRRFTSSFGQPRMLVTPGTRHTWEELLSVADAVVAAAEGDISTTALAWAMGAGVPIVGSATPSVAEMLADRHNAVLCKPGDPRLLAGRILTLLEDADLRRKITETARQTAFEVFGVRRCMDQHVTVYENVAAGRPPGQGITDSAVVA